MARPTTKLDLSTAADQQYDKLMELLISLSETQLHTDFSFDLNKEKGAHWKRDKNIRDVLVHLYEWHQLIIDWISSNQNGQDKQFLKEGYNWRTYGAMNEQFTLNNQGVSYEEALSRLNETHEEVMSLIDSFSNEELFSKNTFPWVGGSTLGSYFVSVTSSHYDWASKKIRKFKKSFKDSQ